MKVTLGTMYKESPSYGKVMNATEVNGTGRIVMVSIGDKHVRYTKEQFEHRLRNGFLREVKC